MFCSTGKSTDSFKVEPADYNDDIVIYGNMIHIQLKKSEAIKVGEALIAAATNGTHSKIEEAQNE